MKRLILKLFLVCLIPIFLASCAHLPERKPWTNPDKALLIGATSANAYDFYTTKKYILNNGGRIKEPWSTLLYLGDERPSTSFFALSKVAQLGLAWIVIDRMESKWRKAILFLMTGTWVYYGVSNSH